MRLLLPALSALLLSHSPQAQDDGTPWVVGLPAPDVQLPDIRTGEEVALSSFRGKKVLLAEFASW